MRVAVAALVLMMGAGAALAQPAGRRVDTVTVTGTREQEAAINAFVRAQGAPSRLVGKITRWRDRVCPKTQGLAPKYAAFISARIRAVAQAAGAPMNPDPGCKPNIDIVFTTRPQALLDNVRKTSPVFLGYYDNNAQADALARVTRPIQSWYLTQTRDLKGNPQIDGRFSNGEVEVPIPCGFPGCDVSVNAVIRLPNANVMTITGSHITNGLSSDFYHVLIVAEPAKLKDHEIGTLADYIAMQALAQLKAPDSCQSLQSITSLLVENCSGSATAMTATDTGYLKGLYSMNPQSVIAAQRNEVAFQMRREMALAPEAPK